jgi:hypothetical protein
MLDGCILWNIAVFSDERRFMNTGTAVAIYGDTLVFGTSFIARRQGGYITIYERKNEKWECKNIFKGKSIAPGCQFPMYLKLRSFIDVSDTVIGVVARPDRIRRAGNDYYDRVVAMFEKQNGSWNYVTKIYGKNEKNRSYADSGEGFASYISVYKNKILIPVESYDTYSYKNFLNKDIPYTEPPPFNERIYKNNKSYIFSIENGKMSQPEELYIPFRAGYDNGNIQLLDKQIFVASTKFTYIDKNEEKTLDKRINIYDYSNNSLNLNAVSSNINDAYQEKHIRKAIIKGNEICIATSKKIYILRKNTDSWDLCAEIDVPNDNFFDDEIAFDNNIVAIRCRKYIYVYRCDYIGNWNLTDKIPLDSLTKHGVFSVSLSIYNHTLVLGINNVNIMDEVNDAIAYYPNMPFFFPENPGKVCIIELLPDEGFKVEEKIIRYYTLTGQVRFKSEIG